MVGPGLLTPNTPFDGRPVALGNSLGNNSHRPLPKWASSHGLQTKDYVVRPSVASHADTRRPISRPSDSATLASLQELLTGNPAA